MSTEPTTHEPVRALAAAIRDGELDPRAAGAPGRVAAQSQHGGHAGAASPGDLHGQRRCRAGLPGRGVGTGRHRLRRAGRDGPHRRRA